MSDTRTEAERLRDAADSQDGGQKLHVLIVSYGLIPEPYLFHTEAAAKRFAIKHLRGRGPRSYVWPTVDGAGDDQSVMDEIDALEPPAIAERLVNDYLMQGGCVFTDGGDEYRLFTEEEVAG